MMKSILFFLITVLVLGLNISCRTGNRDSKSEGIVMHGHLDSVMAGNYNVTYELDSLAGLNHVYALGAMDSLNGEIQIFDDQPYHSIAEGDSILVGAIGNNKAILLVYSEVNNWDNSSLPLSVTNLEALVGYLQYGDQFEKFRTNKSFVFLLEGEAEQLNWHVIRPEKVDSLTGVSNHARQALRGSLEEVDVEIFGVYSKEKEGVITHRGLPVHMHFRTKDGRFAGHVDDLELGPEMTLSLRRSK